jgi:hypothetical protein
MVNNSIFSGIQDQGESIAAMAEKAHFGQDNMGNMTAMTPGMVDVSKKCNFYLFSY